MKSRPTRPEFWRSARIASVSWGARLMLKGLECYVDDNGVGKDDTTLIAAEVFPRDLASNPTETLRLISETIEELRRAGLLWKYEAEGHQLLYLSFWEECQQIRYASKPRFPRPDGTRHYGESYIGASFAENFGNFPQTSANCGNLPIEIEIEIETEDACPPAIERKSRPRAHAERNGSEKARQAYTRIPARSVASQQIARAYSQSLPAPIETGVLTEIAQAIDRCLSSGIEPHAIVAGLRAWNASDSWAPSQIPHFVAKASTTKPKASVKADEWRQSAQTVLDLLENTNG